jgi:outer membrane immunogenic protein
MRVFALPTFLLALGSTSYAADPIQPIQPSVVYATPTTFDWTGGYIGATIGYGWQSGHFEDSEYNVGLPWFPPYEFDVEANGGSVGFQAGHNWQNDKLVYGLEAELGYMNAVGSGFPPFSDPFGDPYDGAGTFSGGWYGSLAAKLGYSLDRTLIYGKLGGIYSGAKVGFLDTCPALACGGPGTIDSSTDLGWGVVLGAGVEHAITENISLKAEYSYSNFGTKNISGTIVGGGRDGDIVNIGSSISAHAVKIGANIRF